MSEQLLNSFLDQVTSRNPGEKEFHQSVYEVARSLLPFLEQQPKYKKAKILERLVEPERIIIFRITWDDDQGEVRVNRGYRVQMNSAIGPYKGGLRFHPSVNLGVMKFLAFEQVFKNSLTTLPLGGGKGGADFDPRGKSDQEVMRFCQAFMNELYRHIGPDTDVPAGDIGVGSREIGYLFGQYRKISNAFTGVLTGKGWNWGGSLMRPEATGYGVVYFLQEMLKARGEDLQGKTITVSGYGNVGSYFIQKACQCGARVITIADENGYVYAPEGIDGEKFEYLRDLWAVHRRPAQDFGKEFGLKWVEGRRPWEVPCDIAVPTATQNELELDDARNLINNGCRCVVEAANMPCSPDAVDMLQDAGLLFAPGKAANAGGVAVSGLEMCQNSQHYCWSAEEVDCKLQQIMKKIHEQCVTFGSRGNSVNYVDGANIAGFVKVADAMLAQGII
ncbi:MAG TPA: NADP-specific glutamate dehydrogenase [Syntrophaceticus sp.]|uniref:Glutamate dehydrogenase n=1 Tax=Syntrophaceticus schinkii TaxID=499207 RepID=A0A0B7MKR2_9FIRM|nr:NADP-specific glutamate dehydrogenase [Syntrophaceticus schinkii]CEO88247.1 glutamate dehydrogenase, NADP-specific [Syntrophaceticus schinkii]HHY30188.1 NADP-specific glutamate dehydrogenase [Syntrophaceticus sp.]